MSIWWSDDCLSCLCNLPHSFQAHMQAVERARAERQEELQEWKRKNRDWLEDDFECEIVVDDL